jgi:multidrug resistance efflux pump
MVRARAAEVELADRQQRRSETLQSRGVASVVDQDIRQTEVRTARARLGEAEANLAALEQVSATRLALEEAELLHARRRAEEARAAAALTVVRAPVDGIVLAIRARAGAALGAGRILDVADFSRLKIVAEVDERFVPRIRQGQKASLRLRGDERRWPAEVSRVGGLVETARRPSADTVTGTDARVVEVDLLPLQKDGLPEVAGLEISVLFEP